MSLASLFNECYHLSVCTPAAPRSKKKLPCTLKLTLPAFPSASLPLLNFYKVSVNALNQLMLYTKTNTHSHTPSLLVFE